MDKNVSGYRTGLLPLCGMLLCFIILGSVERLTAQIDYFLPEAEDLFGLWLSDSAWGNDKSDNDLNLLMVGCDSADKPVVSGFYTLWVKAGNQTQNHKLMLINKEL